MKKKILGVALLATMAVTASANADTIRTYITVGANTTTIGSQSGNGWDIGYGADRTWDNGVYAAFDMNYEQAKVQSDTLQNFGMDIKLGYKWKDIAVYGIGSGVGESYLNATGYGYGYGAGVEYTPHQWKHIGVGLDYKQYKITSELVDYDKDTAKVYLKILF